MPQHGGCLPGVEGKKAGALMMSMAGVAARALLSAHAYNVERTLAVLVRERRSTRLFGGGRMTAARHFDRFAAVPGHDEIVAMAPAAIYSCLARDTSTGVAIDNESADMGATPQEIAAFAVMAAAMLAEACGGTAEARRLAARGTRKITAREAGAVIGRNASTT